MGVIKYLKQIIFQWSDTRNIVITTVAASGAAIADGSIDLTVIGGENHICLNGHIMFQKQHKTSADC
jgi:hypothetical protein